MKKTYKKNKSGFSLVEVLVSLLILSVGILGASRLMVDNIKTSISAKNQIIASGLAQEGIELVRNMKENQPTFNSTDKGCFSGGFPYYALFMHTGSAGSLPCSVPAEDPLADESSTPPLYVDDGSSGDCPSYGGFYGSSATCGSATRTKTKFYREYDIEYDATGVTVTVKVTWNGRGFPIEATGTTYSNCTIANQCLYVTSILPD